MSFQTVVERLLAETGRRFPVVAEALAPDAAL